MLTAVRPWVWNWAAPDVPLRVSPHLDPASEHKRLCQQGNHPSRGKRLIVLVRKSQRKTSGHRGGSYEFEYGGQEHPGETVDHTSFADDFLPRFKPIQQQEACVPTCCAWRFQASASPTKASSAGQSRPRAKFCPRPAEHGLQHSSRPKSRPRRSGWIERCREQCPWNEQRTRS